MKRNFEALRANWKFSLVTAVALILASMTLHQLPASQSQPDPEVSASDNQSPAADVSAVSEETRQITQSTRAEALATLASDYFDEMSGAKQSVIQILAGARKINGVIRPYDFAAASYLPIVTDFAPPDGTQPPLTSSFIDPLVNNPAGDATSQNTQSETTIALGTGTNVVSVFNDSGSDIGGANKFTGYSTSANSGTAWTDRVTLPTVAGGDAGDPVMARNTTTNTILLTTLSFTNAANLDVWRSTDSGVTFALASNITVAGGSQDKEWIAIDNFAGSGNSFAYVFWRNFGTGGGMSLVRSIDNGSTWGPVVVLASASGQGAQVAVGIDHSVYCEWLAAGPAIVLRRSTDFGVTFGPQFTVTPILATGTNGDMGLGSFRSNTFPQLAVNPVSGILYTVYPDNPAGVDRADIFFRQSTDNGATWSAAVRVNTDLGTNDNWQPSLSVMPDGTALFVGFYDRRNSATNTRIEYWGRTASISGPTVTWGCDFPISSSDFPVVVGVDPVVNSVYMGDYDQSTANNTNFYSTWGDNRLGNPDVRFALIPKVGPPCPTPGPSPTPTPVPTPTCAPFSQNFDGVVAPALPAGWTATNVSGVAPLWVTNTTTPDTAPNDAFVDDPATVSDKVLDSPLIAITSAAAQVTFQNFYNLESTFDGGVLEVSSPNIGGGAFTDITNVAVGGSFVTGGYNGTISTAFGSAIAGRQAWTGNAAGYVTTTANLGPNVVGQSIRLRFRMGSDSSVAAVGWRIDSLFITVPCTTPTPSPTGPTPTPSPTPTPTPTASPAPTASPTSSPLCTPLPWSLAANYPTSIESPAVASDGAFAYSAGGFNGAASNAFYRYDPIANSWTTLPSMPTAVYAVRAVYAANTNSVYVFGGLDSTTTAVATTQVYNVATNTWTTGAPMPAARFFPNVAYYNTNGKIYVIGGFDSANLENSTTWEYDPVANTWNTSRLNIPVAMGGSTTSIAGQFIYLVGSWNNGLGSTLHYRYDITNNTWAAMAAAPVAVYEAAGGAIGGLTYLVGGGNPNRPQGMRAARPDFDSPSAPTLSYTSTYLYDLANNSWSTGPNTLIAHSFTGGTVIGNRLLVVGGFNGSVDTNAVEVTSKPCATTPCFAIFGENFDGVTAPALPPGWVATNPVNPDAIFWTTNTTTPDTAPNDAFVNDPATLSDKRLDTPAIFVSSSTAQVSFRNFYNLEGSGVSYFDGGVLEVSSPNIAAGAFTDITDPAAGGSFIAGGYNGTISTGFSSALAGRMAWSQSSGTYISTIANLGPNVAGQSIKLRFRMCSDNSVAATGWRIDRVVITDCPPVSIVGQVSQCASPSNVVLQGVTMSRTGTSSGSVVTNASGTYFFAGLASGGSYTVTPSKPNRAPGSSGINTTDVLAIQRHFLGITLLTGCRLTAADCAAPVGVSTADVIATQKFFLGQTTGIGNVGKYQFTPASLSYSPLTGPQTGENYEAIVLGDVASPYANPRPDGPPPNGAVDSVGFSTVATVSLPEMAIDQSRSSFAAAVKTSAIDRTNKLVGFQGDFTFDERVVTFAGEPVQKAGLTGGNWNVSGNVLDGPGPIRTLRVSAYSNDFQPLSGKGTLFELNVISVARTAQTTHLLWAAPPDGFLFIDADLNSQSPANEMSGELRIK